MTNETYKVSFSFLSEIKHGFRQDPGKMWRLQSLSVPPFGSIWGDQFAGVNALLYSDNHQLRSESLVSRFLRTV